MGERQPDLFTQKAALMGEVASADWEAVGDSASVRAEVSRMREKFHRFNSDEARSAYAHRWVEIAAGTLNKAWPILYELLRLVRDRELYRNPRCAEMPELKLRSYASFEEYFEERVKQPFSTWAELESTYQFVTQYAPDLLAETFEKAKEQVREVQARAEEAKPLAKPGRPTNEEVTARAEAPLPLQEHHGQPKTEKPDDVRFSETRQDYGNSADYLTARIARDAPEVLEEMKAGQHASVRSAAKKAGLVKPELRCVAKVQNVAAAIRKHFTPEEIREIGLLLLERAPGEAS
jgi:hypothetical protein